MDVQASNSRLVGLIEKHNTVIANNWFLDCKILKLIDKASDFTIENTSRISKVKKEIARIKTVINEKKKV